MSSVFPTGVPRFLDWGTSNGLILYHSILTANFSEKVYKMFESPVSATGHRTWKFKGKHASFNVKILLYKFDAVHGGTGSGDYASAKIFFDKLLSYEDHEISFYPFMDGSSTESPLRDDAGSTVSCQLENIIWSPTILEGSLLDTCDVTIRTNDYYNLSKLLDPYTVND